MVDDCIFCKIIHRQIPSPLVYEDERMVAFKDIHPLAPIHLLIVPKKHIATVAGLEPGDPIMGAMTDCANKLAAEMGIAEKGYRLMINCGADGGQMVFHLHMHLLGGQRLDG
jgi:histidine triad (HIT) family protein